MAAQLLGLRLRLLANVFRRRPLHVFAVLIGVVYVVAVAVFAVRALVALGHGGDLALSRDAVTVGGALVVLGFAVLPAVFGVEDVLDPRAFSLYPIAPGALARSLAIAALVSVPVLVLAVVAFATVATWSPSGAGLAAFASALLGIVTCVLAGRISTALGTLVIRDRRVREVVAVVGVLLLLLVSPLLIALGTVEWGSAGRDALGGAATVLGLTPLGAAWAAPGAVALDDGGTAALAFAVAVVTVGLLWAAWRGLVGRMLVTPPRPTARRDHGGLGWFDALRDSPGGVIAARTATYWSRDPRYQLPLLVIPVLPIVILALFSSVGVPWQFLALLPLPLIVLFLGWSLHNDLAYDNSAVWLHVASGVSGVADRLGRTFPTLLIGVPIVLVGAVLTTEGFGDWKAFPSILGANFAILLVSVGVSSFTSVRFPYPAPRPGDSPFVQPQSSGSSGATVQTLAFAAIVVLVSPTLWLVWLAFTDDPAWHFAALSAGILSGALVLWAGIAAGGRVFDRRGPELVAIAVRS